MPFIVVSPHLDDAALSAAWLLLASPGSTIVTVFSGAPVANELSTAWDRSCGFASAQAAMEGRRREDLAACNLLSAKSLWLDCIDSQYGEMQSVESIMKELQCCFADTRDDIVVPVGLHHPDHRIVSNAALATLRLLKRPFIAYADVPYRKLPDVVESRSKEFLQQGIGMSALDEVIGFREKKATVLETYESQWRRIAADGVLDVSDAFAPEQFWRCSWLDMP